MFLITVYCGSIGTPVGTNLSCYITGLHALSLETTDLSAYEFRTNKY
jgi:hypothetical protein